MAAKVHVVFDPKAALPVFYEVTAANTNDITVAKERLPIESGATYIFDLGYYDFGFWADLDTKGCTFVTRLKKNTSVAVLENRTVPSGSNVIADQVVHLPVRMARNRHNPFDKPGRMVTVTLETGKVLRLFSNDLESPAAKIAELYRTRWQIELFFRWIKQNLRIRHFIGRSENAVRLQVATAIITYLLLKLMHRASRTKKAIGHFTRSVQHALFHRIEVATLVNRIERRDRNRRPEAGPQLE
ncbi:IS4 family transposase, partial [Marinibaculum pumilum]